MDLSVLSARIRVRRLASARVSSITQSGARFQLADGTIQDKIFGLVGYCENPQKVGSKKAARWVYPAFQGFEWQDKDHAEGFCKGWNRLVYASLAGEPVEEGIAPPGRALSLNPGVARAIVKDLIPKRQLVSYEISGFELKLSGLDPEKQTRILDGSLGALTDYGVSIRYREEKLVRKGRDLLPTGSEQESWMAFEHGYRQPQQRVSAENGNFWTCGGELPFAWKDARDAGRFCDAVNRLVYHAAMGDDDSKVFESFPNLARSFRAGIKPPPPPDFERHRVLAEHALQEKDYFTALEHYEAGLRSYQTWPEGWFNAALLYEAVGEWDYAVNRMSAYLELVPDAPDAQAAKEKLIVWKEKMRR